MENLEAFRLNKRALKLWWEKLPKMFIAIISDAVVKAVIPYILIYFSARLIEELAGARQPQVLRQLVFTILLSTAALSLLKAILTRWKNSTIQTVYCVSNKIYTDKLMNLDFVSADNPSTHELLSEIEQNQNWSDWGLLRVVFQLEEVLTAVIQIAGAIALTVTLFTSRILDSTSELTILNSPLFLLLFIMLLLSSSIAAPHFVNKGNEYWVKYAEDAKLGNRMFGFYGFMGYDRSRALDIRMYRQDILCSKNMREHNLFGTEAPIAICAKGPMGGYKALGTIISKAFVGVIYIFVCLKAWGGAFGIGLVTQYIGAITAMSTGITQLLTTLGEMKSNGAFLKKTFEFLDIPQVMYQGSLTVEKRTDCNYEIEFRNVSFRYPNMETYALHNVSMKFHIGERLAVVGQNGSGKSTFIKLLCRLYDPTEGEILLNGINIRKYNYEEYLSVFSIVFQDFKLLAFTLGENVATKVNYEKDKVIQSLCKAGFEERFKTLPEGMKSYLYKDFTDKGVEISGGEAQKIAIARALYKEAPFIILDEPTAALDPVAEYEIYTKFNEIVGKRTAVYISHRLSSCRFCDEIAVFHEGEMIEQGSHEELLANKKGKYSELWNTQAQYYLKDA